MAPSPNRTTSAYDSVSEYTPAQFCTHRVQINGSPVFKVDQPVITNLIKDHDSLKDSAEYIGFVARTSNLSVWVRNKDGRTLQCHPKHVAHCHPQPGDAKPAPPSLFAQ